MMLLEVVRKYQIYFQNVQGSFSMHEESRRDFWTQKICNCISLIDILAHRRHWFCIKEDFGIMFIFKMTALLLWKELIQCFEENGNCKCVSKINETHTDNFQKGLCLFQGVAAISLEGKINSKLILRRRYCA